MKNKKESLLQYIPRQLSWQSGRLLICRSQVRDLFGEPLIYSLSSVGQSDTLIRYRSMVRFHQRVPLNNSATKLVKGNVGYMLWEPIPTQKVCNISADSFAEYLSIIGRLAQLGEHLPYKQRVIGSSPIATTKRRTTLEHPSIGVGTKQIKM